MEEKTVIHDVENTKDVRLYELGFLLVPLIVPEELESEVKAVSDIIEKHAGSIRSVREAHSQKLAYPMEHLYAGKKNSFEKAYFGSIIFETQGENTGNLMEALKKHEAIIRFLLITRTEDDVAIEEERLKAEAVEGQKEKNVGEQAADSSDEQIDKAIDQLVTEDAK